MKTAELIGDWTRPADTFPDEGKRLLIYVVYDRRGEVGDFVVYALERMREFCDTIVVVSNGPLTAGGRERLEALGDLVLERPNEGYDIWGYKHGLDAMQDRLGEFDELLLVNDTWFGPIRPFAPLFERMNGHPLHFWGMTDHLRVEPHPFTQEGYLPYHLQSYWVAVRRQMFLSPEWVAYWRDLPEMTSYSDAVTKHEGVFTEHFTQQGFSGEVAFPTLTDKIENHAVLYAEQLIEAGCPTLKRRPFFQWPVFLDRVAVVGKWTLEAAERSGYPVELIFDDLARNVEPRVLNADAALLRVLSPSDDDYDPAAPLRTAVFAHIFYVEMTDEILDRAGYLPGATDLIVTTPDADRARAIEDIIAARNLPGRTEVRVVASNNGRDQAAFLIGCRDILLSDEYDLVVKIHSKKTPQDGPTSVGTSAGISSRTCCTVRTRLPTSSRSSSSSPASGSPSLRPSISVTPRWATPGGRTARAWRSSAVNSASGFPSTRSRRSLPSGRCSSHGRRPCACWWNDSGRTTSSGERKHTSTAVSHTSSSACRCTRRGSSGSIP